MLPAPCFPHLVLITWSRLLPPQLEKQRKEIDRLREEVEESAERERATAAAAERLVAPGAGAEELLRKVILAAGVRCNSLGSEWSDADLCVQPDSSRPLPSKP